MRVRQALFKVLHAVLIVVLSVFSLAFQPPVPLQARHMRAPLSFAGPAAPVTPAADPDLTITKTASASLLIVRQPLTYTMLVRNVGTITTTDVVITDPIPDSLGIAYGSAKCTSVLPCSLSLNFVGRTLSVTVNSIGFIDLVTVTAVVTPYERGLVTNTVYIASQSPEITTTNNIATNTVLIAGTLTYLPIVIR